MDLAEQAGDAVAFAQMHGSVDPVNPQPAYRALLERGGVIEPDERLTREQAIRLYTIYNAYLNHEEKLKGSLEEGKLGDLIVIDRDILECPLKEVKDIRVLLTMVGGKVVYERKGPKE